VVAKDALLDGAEDLLEGRRLFGDRPRAVLVLVALAGDVWCEVAKSEALVVAGVGDELDVGAICKSVDRTSAGCHAGSQQQTGARTDQQCRAEARR
jgi:hypothetical protein